jgi:hypothetical protein
MPSSKITSKSFKISYKMNNMQINTIKNNIDVVYYLVLNILFTHVLIQLKWSRDTTYRKHIMKKMKTFSLP